MHEQEVSLIVLTTLVLRDAGSHRNRGYARRADERIYAPAGGLVHHDAADKSADGGQGEGGKTEQDDGKSLDAQEVLGNHRRADGGGEEDGDNIH